MFTNLQYSKSHGYSDIPPCVKPIISHMGAEI